LNEVRSIQTATALLQAVTLEPDSAVAHEKLALLYAERQFFDLALRHRKAQLELVRQTGRLPSEDSDAYQTRRKNLQDQVEQMQTTVDTNENRYTVRTQTLAGDPLARARLALDLGLAGKALDDVLLRSHADLYGVEGLRLLLELLLRTGRAQDARDLLDRDGMRREPPAGLGFYDLPASRQDGRRWGYRFFAYDWFDLCQAAAAGHYNRASSAVQRLGLRLERDGHQARTRLTSDLLSRLTSEVGLAAEPSAVFLEVIKSAEREQVLGWVNLSQFVLVEQGDLEALEGMLLLERGLPGEAGTHFRQAVMLYGQADDTAPALPGLPLSRRYLERMQGTSK
jgi:hypothetical protein